MNNQGQNKHNLRSLLESFLIDQKCCGNSKRTFEFYEKNNNRFLDWLENEFGNTDLSLVELRNFKLYTLHLKELTKYDNNHKNYSDELLSDKTVQTYIRAVKSFVSWLGKEGFCDEGLAHKIKLPKATNKQVDILSEEEIRIIINTLKAKKTNHYRDLAIFTTFIETGVRLSEMVNLKISNIHFEQGILKVLGKGNKERYVHFGSNVQRNLMKYLQYERPTPNVKTDMLFLKDDGEPIQNTTIVNLFRRLKNATGIEKLHVHLCRHTMVTMRLANGENAFMVKAQTGHSSFDIMNNYFHMAETIKNSRKNNSLIDSMKL